MRRVFTATIVGLIALGATACGSDGASDEPDAVVSPARWLAPSSPAPDAIEFVISVEVGSSSCNFFDRIEVDETDDAVTVSAFVGETFDDVCTADLSTSDQTVTLDAALGERALLGCDPFQPDDASFDCR